MGKAYLGIELGSTRIKAVVIDETGAVLASGSFAWENNPLAEKILSDMLGIPVTTRATAGEGGAWGIAWLATVIG